MITTQELSLYFSTSQEKQLRKSGDSSEPFFERARRGEKERVREKRERKWGLTGSCGLYPIFAVALLGISLLPTIFALLLFTTHYSPHTTHNRSYHPTMVLAQPRSMREENLVILRFHPTMVLAQPGRLGRQPICIPVSIPLWFSLNWKRQWWMATSCVVSIPLWFSLNGVPRLSLVPRSRVSIPLWFSLNEVVEKKPTTFISGFHPTMVLAQRKAGDYEIQLLDCFHPTMVLAQRLPEAKRVAGRTVSIPLWFSLNTTAIRSGIR